MRSHGRQYSSDQPYRCRNFASNFEKSSEEDKKSTIYLSHLEYGLSA